MSFCLRIFDRRHWNSRPENDIHRVQQPQARSQVERVPLQYTRSLDEPNNEASLVHPPKRQGRDTADGNPGCKHKAGEHQMGSELGGLINENHRQYGLTPGNSPSLQDQSGRHGRDLHLLSLDGRGVYSLATLIILKEVLQQYQYLQKLPQLPRPCDVFDLAGGTDSGGIIVILLFRLGMRVDEAITAYTKLLEDVFSQKTVLRSHKETRNSLLMEAIAIVIGSSHVGKNQAQELLMLDDNGPKCFVNTSTPKNLPSTLFRTYITPCRASNSDNCTIVDAIKATIAEEPFFPSINEKVDEALDHGASRINNPLKFVLEEAVSIFPGQFISCVLSIGGGAQNIASRETSTGEFAELPRKVVDDSEFTDEVAKELLGKGGFYCRLNVDHGLEDSGSGGWEGLGEIRMHMQNYLELTDVNEKVSRLAQVLNKRTAIASTVEETLPLLDELLMPNICPRETTEDNSDMQDNSDVQHLTPDHMPETLAYASRHWAMHLVNASKFDDETKQLLEHNVHKQLLAWQRSVPGVRVNPENSTPHRIELYGSKTTGITPTTLLDGCRFIALNIEIFKSFPWHLLPRGPLNARSVSTFGEPEAGYKKIRNPTGSILSFLTEHAEGVSFLISSEDGRKLASASYGGTVRLWDGETGDELAVLRGHSGSINSMAFSLDGTKLASASFDKVRLWDSQTGSEIAVLRKHSGSVNSVAFSPIGTKLASASSDGTVRLWDGKTCAEVNVLRGHSDSVESVVFSPDGMKLASTSLDGTMRLWDGQSGAEITLLHSESIESVAFSSDGTKLALASYNGIVQLCDSQTGDEIARYAGSAFVGFTLDSARLILMSAEEVYQVDCRSGDRLACEPLGVLIDSDVEAVRVSASDLWVIRVNQKSPSLQGLLVVKADHNAVLHVMPLCWFPPNLPVTGFAVSSLSRVVVGCKDGRILLFDTHLSSLSPH